MNFRQIRSFTYCFLLLLTGFCECTPATATVLARGDGFIVDSSDVEAHKAFFSEKGFESTDSEYLNSALKIRLFVIEAKNSGLIDSLPEPAGPYKHAVSEEYYRLFMLYYQHLMETYPVSDVAVQSYYLSYPEKFLKNSQASQDDADSKEILPLDDNIKSWIRNQIVISKQVIIVENEFQRLKTKYHVVVE